MILILVIVVVSAFALIAVGTILKGKPKKAEKSEKGAIIKQLVALSEAEHRRLAHRIQI